MERKIFAWTIAFLVLAATVSAERGGGPKPTSHGSPGPKTTVSHGNSAPKPATAGPKTTTKVTKTTGPVKSTKPVSAKPVSTKSVAPKPAKTTASMKPAKTTTTTSRGKNGKTMTTAASVSSTSLPPTNPTTTTTLSPAQQKLQRNTNLASKLQSRLPAGTDLQLAAAGFRNLGQFVAAVNVSNNLGIPFTQLKIRMVDQGMSLGQAIQDTRPRTTDTTVVVARAERDADDMIRTSEAETSKTKTKKTRTGTK